jgi:TolB-like protein/Tfp pilus assembly protein PilF
MIVLQESGSLRRASGVGGRAMTDLFVSYKSDDRVRVAPLVAALEADGVGVWWDAHIGGGSEWRDTIESELNAARCVLVVWSQRSTGPGGSFVRDEATRALRRGTYLPVRIDPVEPPLGFGETQALSLIGWKGDRTDPRYLALLAAAQAVIAGKPRPIPAAYEPKRGVDRRLMLGGGATVAVAAGLGGWWALHRGSAPGDSIAVMPFANLSGDPAQAYFSDGIAEELRDALTRIASLKVAARTSSELMRDADVATAAAKLGVANILTGSVRRGAGTIRINAELVDGKSGLTRWAQAYDRMTGDALAIQTNVAESVADALQITLGHAQKALLSIGGTTSTAAQDAFLRGRNLVRQNKVGLALKEYDAAIAADPNYAGAHALRASYVVDAAQRALSGAALRTKLSDAEAEARRAMALAPGWGVPLAVLGIVLQTRLDLRGAREAFDAAFKALPGDATVLRTKGSFDSLMGNEDAIALWQRAQALDPLRPRNPLNLANLSLNLGRLDDAIAAAQTGLARFPNDAEALVTLSQALLAKGQPGEAMKAAVLVPPGDYTRPFLESVATAATDRAASDHNCAILVEKFGDVAQYQIAAAHAWRREPDLAFTAIARAWNLLDPGLLQFKTDPLLASLRADPRYGEWLRKIGFP